MADDVSEDQREKGLVYRVSEWIGVALGVLIILVGIGAVVAAVVMVGRLASSGKISPEQNPLNTIFSSRLMVGAVRIAILVFVVYAVVSMLVFMRRGQFLSRVGPVQVSESVQAVATESETLRGLLGESLDENERLQMEVAELTERLEATDRYLDSVLEYMAQLADSGEDGEGVDDAR